MRMSIRKETPCDFGECPYRVEYSHGCEYWCGEPEPEEDYDDYDDDVDECGYDPYIGAYSDDC